MSRTVSHRPLEIDSPIKSHINKKTLGLGILSFTIVLLFMPLGHTLMILNEELLPAHRVKLIGAIVIGAIGLALLIMAIKANYNNTVKTLLGLIAGILVWTGWIEFSFVWIANRLQVMPYMENGEVATKPEYLIMPSSIGILGAMLLIFLFSDTKCQLFVWFQKLFGLRKTITTTTKQKKPLALTTFIETIMIIWTFYIVLLLAYDANIAGDRHILTYIVAFGSLAWSGYLIINLLKISRFDYSVRYAIPTVIIFWNFIEVLGRWNLFKEIWIHPFEYIVELSIITIILVALITFMIVQTLKGRLKVTA
ncbi:MAG: hypothetical protein KF781_04345 [Chitinophagaceae bacterium]|nr:hypothetical protein [Chitinophagaceae bacterium]MCW5904686.1 hypothetical protein [Chitinophagaceae bacterium]